MHDWIASGVRVRCTLEFETPNPLIPSKPFTVRVGREADVLSRDGDWVRLGWFSFGGFDSNGHITCPLKDFVRCWELCHDKVVEKTAEPKPMILAPSVSGGFKRIGFWATSHLPEKDWYNGEFPWPGDFINNAWNRGERAQVVAYLKAAPISDHYFGPSTCRICDEENGYTDKCDGTYVWPEGFAHYVEKHGVVPAQEFIDHVKAQVVQY